MKPEAFAPLLAFRERAHHQFKWRADVLFEMLDALLALPSATAPAHMMMLPGFQRRWGSIYDALSAGRIDTTGVEDLIAQYPLDGGESVFAVDASTWPRCDAETSPDRGYYHHHNRHSAGKPIVAGWSYQWLAQVSFRHDSWCAPLSAHRVEPRDNMHHVAATQMLALLERCQHHTKMPIFVFDAGYDAVQLAYLLGNEPLALLVRLRSNRCFYAEPAERISGGRPRVHGEKFAFRDPQTWGNPTMEYLTDDTQYGQVHVQAWPRLHAKPDQHTTKGTYQPRPIIPGTLIRITVKKLPKETREPKPRTQAAVALVAWSNVARLGTGLAGVLRQVSARALLQVRQISVELDDAPRSPSGTSRPMDAACSLGVYDDPPCSPSGCRSALAVGTPPYERQIDPISGTPCPFGGTVTAATYDKPAETLWCIAWSSQRGEIGSGSPLSRHQKERLIS